MNKKEFSFLEEKLFELVDNNIISNSQCTEAREYFGAKKENKSISTIFAAIGVFLIALAIITFFAMNWDNIGKPLKVIIAFIPITITSILLHQYLKTESKNLKLYTSIFAPVSIIATNSLITQIFHIQSEIFELFFTSLLMYMPIAFILFNKLSIVVYSIGTIIYSLVAIETYGSEGEALLRSFILALPILISNFMLYIKDKQDYINIILWVTNVILGSLLLFHKELISAESIIIYFYMLYFLTQTLYGKQNKLCKVLSVIFSLFLIISCTSADLLEYAEEISPKIDTILITALAGLFIYLSNAYVYPKEYFVFAFILLTQFSGLPAEVLFVLVNLIAIALGIYKIVLGSKKAITTEVKQGITLIVLLIAFRFMSSELSFGVKTLLFAIGGLAFIAAGKVVNKRIGGNTND